MWDGPVWYVKFSPRLARLIWTNSLNGLSGSLIGQTGPLKPFVKYRHSFVADLFSTLDSRLSTLDSRLSSLDSRLSSLVSTLYSLYSPDSRLVPS